MMSDNEIQEIADSLIRRADPSTAYFGIVDVNQNFHFRSNKDGLRLLAAELLYASVKANKSNHWGITDEWYDSSALEINSIEIIDAERNRMPGNSASSPVKSTLLNLGCGLAGIILLVFFAVGAWTTIKAIIHLIA